MTSYTPIPPSRPPSPAPVPAPAPISGAPLTAGPLWYRSRIRAWGPLVALLIPAAIGAGAYSALRFSEAAWSGATGLIGGVLAAPGLLAVGAPFGDRGTYPIAIAASGLLWMAVGLLASRRATRHPVARWSDYWRHYFWMAFGIWTGAGIALAAATFSIGDSLL